MTGARRGIEWASQLHKKCVTANTIRSIKADVSSDAASRRSRTRCYLLVDVPIQILAHRLPLQQRGIAGRLGDPHGINKAVPLTWRSSSITGRPFRVTANVVSS